MNMQAITKIEDSELFYSKEYSIKYYEMDFNRTLKPSNLLNYLQDMATINAEMLGFGFSFTYPKNYGWFLVKYRMEFDEYPSELDEIVIKTEARGVSKILANRDFEIWTSDNKKRLGRVASSWMMIDLSTKNVIPLSKTFPQERFAQPIQKRENDLQFQKIKQLEKIDYEKIFEIRYDDIDVNQHVNNSNYLVWALETLPYEYKSSRRIKTLDIIYKKEIAYGNNVLSQIQFDEENRLSTHVLKNAENGDDLCFINVVWDCNTKLQSIK